MCVWFLYIINKVGTETHTSAHDKTYHLTEKSYLSLNLLLFSTFYTQRQEQYFSNLTLSDIINAGCFILLKTRSCVVYLPCLCMCFWYVFQFKGLVSCLLVYGMKKFFKGRTIYDDWIVLYKFLWIPYMMEHLLGWWWWWCLLLLAFVCWWQQWIMGENLF